MKKTKLGFVALLASLALVGCAGGEPTGSVEESAEEKAYTVAVASTSKYVVDGKITSKKDIRDAYAMKGTNGCTLEWYEQAAEIEGAVAGKTAAQITAAETFGAATIAVGSLKNAVLEAADYAGKEHVGPQANNAVTKQHFAEGGVKADGAVYTGLGYVASLSSKAQASVTVAYAAFDASGKVVDARFDVVQIDLTATAEAITLTQAKWDDTTDKGQVASKLEKGYHYNMLSAYGSQLAEVDEQIEALADWSVGKTAAEFATESAKVVYGGDYGDKEKPNWINEATISTGDFATALSSAYAKATEATAANVTTGSRAGVGIVVDALRAGSTELTINISGAMVKGAVETALVDAVVIPLNIVEVK